jgi:hypothetical protein
LPKTKKDAVKLKCIIVEDEIMARKPLQQLCEQHDSLQLIAAFDAHSHEIRRRKAV